jgi:hypothetical protein
MPGMILSSNICYAAEDGEMEGLEKFTRGYDGKRSSEQSFCAAGSDSGLRAAAGCKLRGDVGGGESKIASC